MVTNASQPSWLTQNYPKGHWYLPLLLVMIYKVRAVKKRQHIKESLKSEHCTIRVGVGVMSSRPAIFLENFILNPFNLKSLPKIQVWANNFDPWTHLVWWTKNYSTNARKQQGIHLKLPRNKNILFFLIMIKNLKNI